MSDGLLRRLLGHAETVARAGAWAAGVFILVAAAVITVDVLCRKLFAISLGGSDELSGYVLAIGSAWGFSFALLRRANIRVDAVYKYLGPAPRAALDLLATVSLTGFVAVVGWYAWSTVATSLRLASRSNTPLAVPLAIPQSLWLAGLAFFLVVLLLVTAAAAAALVRGEWREVDRLAGLPSTESEVEEELSGVQSRLTPERDPG